MMPSLPACGPAYYAAAKMGWVGLALTVAIEGARYGIQSNALSPLAYTSMTEGMSGGAVESFAVSDVVPIAVYRVSEAC
jgi:NAD(P)-dependent dehydrogenase (short-subunit alcohol dehydrogenase family)